MACINHQCQNPCGISSICSSDQECLVQDTLPLRTVICQCPPDTIADNNGHCKQISKYSFFCLFFLKFKLSKFCLSIIYIKKNILFTLEQRWWNKIILINLKLNLYTNISCFYTCILIIYNFSVNITIL